MVELIRHKAACEGNRGRLTVAEMCRVLGVTRAQVFRTPKARSPQAQALRKVLDTPGHAPCEIIFRLSIIQCSLSGALV